MARWSAKATPAPISAKACASLAELSNQIDMIPRMTMPAMTRLTPCLAQNWKRVPVRVPMNRLRSHRNATATR